MCSVSKIFRVLRKLHCPVLLLGAGCTQGTCFSSLHSGCHTARLRTNHRGPHSTTRPGLFMPAVKCTLGSGDATDRREAGEAAYRGWHKLELRLPGAVTAIPVFFSRRCLCQVNNWNTSKFVQQFQHENRQTDFDDISYLLLIRNNSFPFNLWSCHHFRLRSPEIYILTYNGAYSSENQPTFRKNL
jgi:hypothetical protein